MGSWKIINSQVLLDKRATYGGQVVERLAEKLVTRYGASFHKTGINRMMKFAHLISESEIVATPWQQLSWSHIREIIPVKDSEARKFYVSEVAGRNLGVRALKRLISTKSYERRDIANTQLTNESAIPFNAFKDPYMLDMLGLKSNIQRADLERAILHGLEEFILEFGKGFTFMARQKRMPLNDDDFYLDLLRWVRKMLGQKPLRRC